MRIAVLTNVRTDTFFLALWVAYYGSLFGRENLHIMLDGDDWTPEVDLSGVNLHIVPDVPRERPLRLGYTSRWQSRHAAALLRAGADLVLRTDIDEFVAADPACGMDLPALLSTLPDGAATAALGLDMIQSPDEGPLDPVTPILGQRRHAILTREFCKLVAIRRPVRWVGGFHRARNVDIDIAPGLLLFHLALFDRAAAEARISQRKTTAEHNTQGAHIADRLSRFAEVANPAPPAFDSLADRARSHVMASIPSRSGPHPGHIPDGNTPRGYHLHLPDRLADLLPRPADAHALFLQPAAKP